MHNITPPPMGHLSRPVAVGNTMDTFKGTSFRYSQWSQMTHFFNNEYIIDFVGWDGCLWACTMSHLSSEVNCPKDGSPYWSKVITGVEGKVYVPKIKDGKLVFELEATTSVPEIEITKIKGDPGKDGITYVPHDIKNGNLIFKASDGSDKIKIDISSLKGERGDKGDIGKTPELKLVTVNSIEPNETPSGTFTPIASTNGTAYKLELKLPKGERGQKGDKGDPGKPGPTPSFKLNWKEDETTFGAKSLKLECTIDGTTIDLGEVGGKSPKLMRVLSTVDDPDTQDGTRRNDRILWGYDGVPVDEWATLCFLDELRGDQNIVVGCPNNLKGWCKGYDEFGGPSDHDKIWYDPCDESIGDVNTRDFLYKSYLEIGGNLRQEDFESAFIKIAESNGFAIEFRTSFDELPKPSKKELGKIYLVPSDNPEKNDLFDQWIVVNGPDPDSESYMWERWGSGSSSVNLSNYYNKTEIDSKILEIQETLQAITNNDVVKVIDETPDSGISLAPGNVENSVKVIVNIPTLAEALNNSSKLSGDAIILGRDISELLTADKTITESIEILAEKIKTSVTGGITSITSPDNSISIEGDDTTKILKVNMSNIVATGSTIATDDDGKLDVFWIEN